MSTYSPRCFQQDVAGTWAQVRATSEKMGLIEGEIGK